MTYHTGLLICDLSGYSAMTEAHGPQSAAGLIRRFLKIIDGSISGNTRLIERVGDEVVLASQNIDDLIKTAINIQHLAEVEPGFLSVHIGIHFGEIYEDAGHLYGSALNITARIVSCATGGQILCSASAKEKIKDLSDFRIESLGPKKFKNIRHAIHLYKIMNKATAQEKFRDPVCHMKISVTENSIKLQYRQNDYFFCSMDCLSKFASEPEQYLSDNQKA